MKRTISAILLTLAAFLTLLLPAVQEAQAKTTPLGQTVGSVLYYISNSGGDEILVSQIPVTEMEADMKARKISETLHNYSLLDRYVTALHQEAQGFTVPEFVDYAKSKSTLPALRSLPMTFMGKDVVRFWEIDQTGYDSYDTYTYDALYKTPRYNFPLLYRYWNYKTQDYYDPDGKMTREQVIDHIFSHGEKEAVLLSVRAFSQRYMITDTKYGTGDYNMESYWHDLGLMDTERTIRVMKPMTKDELYNKTPTASDSRYWVSNILLNMANAPDIKPLGSVAAPAAVMTEDADNYYIRFSCSTSGATIYYNHNYISPSYTPTAPYTGNAVVVPKSWFPGGTVTMTTHAVKDGWSDAGVVTLKLTSSGLEAAWKNPFGDVKSTDWYYDAVSYVMQKGFFDPAGSGLFGPDRPMTRAMLVTALYRMEGSPVVTGNGGFKDIPANAGYKNAVQWAYDNGIVQGVSATSFNPGGSITREQIAVMFYQYALYKDVDTSAAGDLAVFSDGGKVSDWAWDAMTWAVGKKLINGMGDNTSAPQGTATRAQVAKILQGFSQGIE